MFEAHAVEQRRQQRVSCSLAVQVHAPTQDVLLFTYALNLSPQGVFVRANRPLPVGTRVHVELHPQPAGDRLALEGLVVRVADESPRGMGLRFVDGNSDLSKELSRLVDRIGFTDETSDLGELSSSLRRRGDLV